MKKRWILTAILLLGLIFTGCGTKKTNTDDTTAESAETSIQDRIDLADGGYAVDFETDSSMFKSNDGKGTLTVKDGKATLHISLSSKNIVNLYLGTAEDAKKNEKEWLQPTTDTVTYDDGLQEEVFGFDVPVPCIGEDFDLALIGKKGVWYDHKVSVQNPVPIASETSVPTDGSYTCEVTLQGGSGRATVESPASLTIQNGKIMATLVWSSPYYEYMLVDDVQYDPIQTEGNSTFEIPVTLDTEMEVSALTVAMSEPHLIAYTLHFDSSTLKGE